MTINGQAGSWGFAPQIGYKNRTGLVWHRHKALFVGQGVNDDARPGPPEIGGRPVPGSAYKNGYFTAGDVTINPRLEDTLGWLLYGALGDVSTSTIADKDGVHGPKRLAVGAQVGDVEGIAPLLSNQVVTATVTRLGGANFAGTVTVHGKDAAGVVAQEDLVFVASPLNTTIAGVEIFSEINAIDWPAYAAEGDMISVGIADTAVNHSFRLNATNPGHVPHMAFRKRIPPNGVDLATDVGEVYYDSKILNLGLAFPNEGLIEAQVSTLGCDFAFDEASDGWVWQEAYEDFETIPVACAEGSYLRAISPITGFSSDDMAVLGAQVSIVNQPVSMREMRIFGSPRLHDITVTTRGVQFTVQVLYDSPSLYKAALTNSLTGTHWSSKPFVAQLDVEAVSSDVIPTKKQPYSLKVTAPKVLLALNGPIQLAPGKSVIMTFQGQAIDPSSGEYAEIILRNAVAAYTWPV